MGAAPEWLVLCAVFLYLHFGCLHLIATLDTLKS